MNVISRICDSITPILCTFIFSLFITILAGNVGGEGTVLVDLGDDLLTQEDSAINLMSSVSYTGTKGLTYHWDFDDGSTSSAQMPIKTYTRAGDYTVSLSVTDTDGISDSDTMLVSVLNVRPIANAGGPKTVFEGTTVTFDASNSWDTSSDLPLLTYEWDFGDGIATDASANNKVVTHNYFDPGVFVTRLVVRDDDWKASNYIYLASEVITVDGSSSGNGTVSFTWDHGVPTGGGSGNGSGGDSGSGTNVFWDFGDGSWEEGNNVSHTFQTDGLYIVTLILTDGFGAMSVHTIMVTVLNRPPTAEAGEDLSGNEDDNLMFVGQGSDPGGGPISYSWDLGDGNSASGRVVSHVYTKQGTYTATLTVRDCDGLTATDTRSVSITNVPPQAGLTSNHTTEEGDIIGFYGSTSTDTPSDIPLLVYNWNFGDGSTASGISVSHAYVDEGTYTVTLTVTDDDSAVDVTTMVVPVDNANPTASIDSVTHSNTDLLPGDTVSFTGSGTDPGTTDTLSFSWNFGDSGTATGSSTSHSYSSAGTYTVTLTVSDGDGGSATDTVSVTVTPQEELAEEAQTEVEEAPSSSFSNTQAQEVIEDKFDDLIEALEDGDSNTNGKITSLIAQVNNKVTDEDLRDYLLDVLNQIKDSLD